MIQRSRIGFGNCFADPTYVDGDFRKLFIAPLVKSRHAFAGQLRLLRSLHELDNLTEIDARIVAPVRLIWGALDPFFPLKRARSMVDNFGGAADIRVIDEGKLFVHEDFPTRFANEVLDLARRAAAA